MKPIDIVAIIAVALIGIGICAMLIVSAIIEYRQHKNARLADYLHSYYYNYHLALLHEDKIQRFTDDIYFVMGKEIAYPKCEDLAQLLIELGYCLEKDNKAGEQSVREFMKKFEEKYSERLNYLKDMEEKNLKEGNGEAAARCDTARREIENVLKEFNNLIDELYGVKNKCA